MTRFKESFARLILKSPTTILVRIVFFICYERERDLGRNGKYGLVCAYPLLNSQYS